MKSITVHIGIHKTGTTSIQRALADQREALAEIGILYPSMQPAFKREADAHHKVADALRLESREKVRSLARFRCDLFRDAPRKGTTLLSSETVSRQIADSWDGRDHDSWFRLHRRYLKRLRLFLADFSPEILVYLRQPHAFAKPLFKSVLSNVKKRRPPHSRRSSPTGPTYSTSTGGSKRSTLNFLGSHSGNTRRKPAAV